MATLEIYLSYVKNALSLTGMSDTLTKPNVGVTRVAGNADISTAGRQSHVDEGVQNTAGNNIGTKNMAFDSDNNAAGNVAPSGKNNSDSDLNTGFTH